VNPLRRWQKTWKTRAGKNPAHRFAGKRMSAKPGPDDPQRIQLTCSCGWESPVRTSSLVASGDWRSHLWEVANRETGRQWRGFRRATPDS
jgi:hypothetical protein